MSGAKAKRGASPKTNRRLYRRFRKEVAAAGFPTGPGDDRRVTDHDLMRLPAAAQRYMRFMGVVGRPRDWSIRARFVGRFRTGASSSWMPAEAWQYNSALAVGRVYSMRLVTAKVFSMSGTDSYLQGRGRMHGKLMGMFTVADGQGPEFDVGELTTYLNDAILLAPSFLLGDNTTWDAVDDDSFDVILEDSDRHVTARVFIDERKGLRSTSPRLTGLPTFPVAWSGRNGPLRRPFGCQGLAAPSRARCRRCGISLMALCPMSRGGWSRTASPTTSHPDFQHQRRCGWCALK